MFDTALPRAFRFKQPRKRYDDHEIVAKADGDRDQSGTVHCRAFFAASAIDLPGYPLHTRFWVKYRYR